MKQTVSIFLILVFCVTLLTSCGKKVPEGIDNEKFYNDMIECLKLTEKALKNKNRKYTNEIKELIIKNTSDNFFDIIYGLEEEDEKIIDGYGLNEKEQEILVTMVLLYHILTDYINSCLYDTDIDTDKLIDIRNFEGKRLYRTLQDLIELMEVDYDISYIG